MKLKKKHFIVGGVVLFLALIAGFVVFAQSDGPWFCNGGFHPGWHGRGFHSKFPGQDFSEHVLDRLDRGAEFLELSESQRQAYEEIRAKMKAHLTEGMEERRKFFSEIQTEMDQNDPDIERIANAIKERTRELPALIEEHVDLFVAFYDILDEGQRAQLVKMIRMRMGRRSDS